MKRIEEVLKRPGALVVMPTDTVYGLVARATDTDAVARLYAAKHRHHKPGTLIAANIDQLVGLGIPRRYLTAVEQFWPGAVSIVIPCGDELSYLAFDKHSLAVRVPDHPPEMLDVLSRTGPLLTTSANLPGKPTAANIAEAKAYFGDTVDAYKDGGDLTGHAPSTVIRVIDDAIEVLRQGAVYIDNTGRKHDTE